MQTKPERKTYTISELAKEYGITPRAIRLYEERGLLAPTRDGNRRVYSERDRVRLRLTLRAKRLGMSLQEAKELIEMYDSSPDKKVQIQRLLAKLDERREILKRQREDIEHALAEIEDVYQRAQASLRELGEGLA